MARTKGAKNKVPQSVKENIVAVFTRLGGTAAMAKWAEKNQDQFYRMYGSLAPKEIVAEVDSEVTVNLISYADSQPADD